MMLSGIADIFSGGGKSGYGDMSKYLQQGQDAINQNYDQGREYYRPYYEAGTNAIPGYMDAINRYKDPNAYYDEIMGNYKQSQGATNQINSAQTSMEHAGAASGMAGSPALQTALAGKVSDIVGADQNNYLNQILGIGDRYTQGQGNLMDQGFNAGGQMATSRFNEGNILSQILAAQGQSAMGQDQADASAWGSGMGMAGNIFSNWKPAQKAMSWMGF